MKNKFNNKCQGTFEDCELAILRMAVDKAGDKLARRKLNSPEITQIISIVEGFLKRKNLICYGGTAINNILPVKDQFYNKDVEIPDYDFFSPNALNDAKELANIYYRNGFEEVEAKAGQHYGTYKVFVNFIPVADITLLSKEIYMNLKKESVRVAGILYAPPNFLRMAMYLELSRPAGDTSRWEKVLKRIMLLNKHYPLKNSSCEKVDFQRNMENENNEEIIYNTVKDVFINQGAIFFGGYAISLYSKYMPKKIGHKLNKIADFDVLSKEPHITAQIIKERLSDVDITNVSIKKRDPVGEVVPLHYEVRVNNDTIAFIYKPIACHSYNVLNIKGEKIRVATIDTMLNFYLAFLYTNRPYFSEFKDRILCMSQFLFDVQQKNRLAQKGLLRRFSINCYGHQESVEEIRSHKNEMYLKLKNDRNSPEFEEWFLNYKPSAISNGSDKKSTSRKSKNFSSKQNKHTKQNKLIKPKTKKNKRAKKKKSSNAEKSRQSRLLKLIYGKNRRTRKNKL